MLNRLTRLGLYTNGGNVFVIDDFGNAITLSDDQFQDALDRAIVAMHIRKAGEPC